MCLGPNERLVYQPARGVTISMANSLQSLRNPLGRGGIYVAYRKEHLYQFVPTGPLCHWRGDELRMKGMKENARVLDRKLILQRARQLEDITFCRPICRHDWLWAHCRRRCHRHNKSFASTNHLGQYGTIKKDWHS